MRTLLLLVLIFGFFNCESNKKVKTNEVETQIRDNDLYEPTATESASIEENYQVGVDFLNNYIESMENLEILEFVKNSELASEDLKNALEDLVIKSWEENPKIGLLFNPLFDAQDYPSEGVEKYSFDPAKGIVVVQGINWKDFKVAMRIIEEDGHLLVDGCGAVNMPLSQRMAR